VLAFIIAITRRLIPGSSSASNTAAQSPRPKSEKSFTSRDVWPIDRAQCQDVIRMTGGTCCSPWRRTCEMERGLWGRPAGERDLAARKERGRKSYEYANLCNKLAASGSVTGPMTFERLLDAELARRMANKKIDLDFVLCQECDVLLAPGQGCLHLDRDAAGRVRKEPTGFDD
jgi:hypothetical protein